MIATRAKFEGYTSTEGTGQLDTTIKRVLGPKTLQICEFRVLKFKGEIVLQSGRISSNSTFSITNTQTERHTQRVTEVVPT